MSKYKAIYEIRFVRNLERYSSFRQRIKRRIEQILEDPYSQPERLGRVPGEIDLRGCRSSRIDRNFRIIFVICEECRHIKGCMYCFCEDKEDKTVIFLTVGPHHRAYSME
jgi:mRNA-degrading endonuclease RelE of RelBE toxin-antitoxin system